MLRFEDDDVTEGVIKSLTGEVEFNIKYRAIFLRPFKNEIMDASVTNVTPVRLPRRGAVPCRASPCCTP